MADKNDPPSGSAPKPHIHSATPRTQRTNAGNNTVPAVRSQIAHEMEREFVLCDIDNFMEEYLPFVPDDECVRECVSGNLRPRKLVFGTFASTLRFTKYPTPPTTSLSEVDTYADLKKISDVIGGYDYPHRSRNRFHYQNTPHSSIYSDIDGSTHKVDACFTSDPAPPAGSATKLRLNTTSMAVPMEHKLTLPQVYDNNKQIVSANVQIMNDDVRRMFTFGITIECDQVTLWYHCRSHSAVSTSFSFVEEPKLLIKVFMSILFAKDVELGYDPNVTKGEDTQYTFEIRQEKGANRFFRTISPIAEYRSNNITGRMTRIFKVIEVNTKNPKKYVLKDVWIEADAPTEGQIQTALFGDIEKFWTNATPDDMKDLEPIKSEHAKLVLEKKYKDFFLAIETDCLGETSKEVPSYAVPEKNMFHAPAITSDFQKSLSLVSRKSVGTPRPIFKANPPVIRRKYTQKKQYRVVFKEICTPLGELKTLGRVTDILEQVITPLQLMFCAGWVHRDISSGNILAYKHKNTWKVKLSDLEYAKKFPPPPDYIPATDPKTGTPYFMPHEILANDHIYNADVPLEVTYKPNEQFGKGIRYIQAKERSHDISNDDGDDDGDEDGDEDDSDYGYNKADPDRANSPTASVDSEKEDDAHDYPELENPFLVDRIPIVIHNFQHDLESVWWLMLWTLTARIKNDISNDWAKIIFQNTLQLNLARQQSFIHPINPQLRNILAEPVKDLSEHMDKLRQAMVSAYFKREKSGNIRNAGSYVNVHLQFLLFFEELKSDNSWQEACQTKLTVDRSHRKETAGQNAVAQDVSEGTPLAPSVQPQSPASGKTQVKQPARVKRELSDDERPPPRHPGPSKRSKR